MQSKGTAAVIACLSGLISFIVLITLGELTGSPALCWTVVGLLCLAAGGAICWDRPGNFWFTGLLLNLPIWLLMFAQAGIEEFHEHLAGMLASLLLAYLGAGMGAAHLLFARRHRSHTP